MAYDLSILIQDGLCNTLQNLLGSDTKLNGITKVDARDLQNSELLKIESEFVFEKLSSVFSFIIPAVSASLIFNIQMGDTQTEPALKIDDDTLDAIQEFISTVSGGLTTSINGEEIEDLGKVKFHIAGNETLQGDEISNIDNMYRFSIDIDEHEIIIFMLFDESIIPYIDDITMKPVTEHPDEIIIEEIEEKEEEIENNSDEEKPENSDKDTEELENKIETGIDQEKLDVAMEMASRLLG